MPHDFRRHIFIVTNCMCIDHLISGCCGLVDLTFTEKTTMMMGPSGVFHHATQSCANEHLFGQVQRIGSVHDSTLRHPPTIEFAQATEQQQTVIM